MNELFNNAPTIITAASRNPLALGALFVMTTGILAYLYFRPASELTRVTGFFVAGLASLAVVVSLGVLALIGGAVTDFTKVITTDKPEAYAPPAPAPARVASARFASSCDIGTQRCPLALPDQLPIGSGCTCVNPLGQMYQGVVR